MASPLFNLPTDFPGINNNNKRRTKEITLRKSTFLYQLYLKEKFNSLFLILHEQDFKRGGKIEKKKKAFIKLSNKK